MTELVHQLITRTAARVPGREALRYQGVSLSYREFAGAVEAFAASVIELGLERGARVAVYAEKRFETVVAMFGTAAAGGAYVPVNPLLKADQVAYILRDCDVRILVTSPERLQAMTAVLAECPALRQVIVMSDELLNASPGASPALVTLPWKKVMSPASKPATHRVIDQDMAAILYTSGSTGRPKGVVLSHRNIVAGACSVAEYLELTQDDRILSVMPLSFDYGMNQLTTAFLTGATAVLMNYLFPRDIVNIVQAEKITGLGAVPPLWIQLAQLEWPESARQSLRYITNTGGHMPKETLARLRAALPDTSPYLMYGLTEAFRSTYLPPSEIDRRIDSIGKAIPNAEILVVREDGSPCAPGEPGELVHRGVLVSLGYWNDREKTAERFKPVPGADPGFPMTEYAVWSGDTVKTDEDGYIYFVGRRDEMIKTSGYRISPTELEEVIHASTLVGEVAALGIAHPVMGQAIVIVAMAAGDAALAPEAIIAYCKKQLPAYMVPAKVEIVTANLPRNPNGKIDRKQLAAERQDLFRG